MNDNGAVEPWEQLGPNGVLLRDEVSALGRHASQRCSDDEQQGVLYWDARIARVEQAYYAARVLVEQYFPMKETSYVKLLRIQDAAERLAEQAFYAERDGQGQGPPRQ